MQRFHAARAGWEVVMGEDLTLTHRQCRRVAKRVRKADFLMEADYRTYFVTWGK